MAYLIGGLVGIAIRTLVFPLILEKILVLCRVNQKIAMIFGYILYAMLAWPFMLFVTYGYEEGLGNIILDIPFLFLWVAIRLFVLRKRKMKELSSLTKPPGA